MEPEAPDRGARIAVSDAGAFMPLPLLLALLALAPVTAVAAPYKCLVDGKTTYQDRPCDPDNKEKGQMTGSGVQSKNGQTLSGTTVVTREENQRRAAVAKTDMVPLARQAYGAMVTGNMYAWSDMLCPRVKQQFQRGLADMTRTQGVSYAKRKVELVRPTDVSPEGVTFVASEANPAAGPTSLRVHFDWYDGRPCLLNISHSGGEIRQR
jgi:hypothetical protein